MSTNGSQVVREILKAAMASGDHEIAPEEYHPIDDEDLLYDWSVGDLDAARHRRVLDHLAKCAYCREELAYMIRVGALVLPHPEESRPQEEQDAAGDVDENSQPATLVRSTLNRFARRIFVAGIWGAAVTALIVMLWRISDPRNGPSVVEVARRELQAGRPAAALELVAKHLEQHGPSTDQEHAKAVDLLEESAYRLARAHLKAGQFQQVLKTAARVARYQALSSRLTNLRLQAERGVPSERTLELKGALTDYQYALDGRSTQRVSSLDARQVELEQDFSQAVQAHPKSLDLRLNLGQFLLEQNEFDRAAEQFTVAMRLKPSSHLAHTGSGLALFRQSTPPALERALAHFQRAVELSPEDGTAHLNLAICLTRLGRPDEAKPYFRKAHALLDDASLKKQIERLLTAE